MLDKDILNINENCFNYIQSDPKLVLSVEDIEVLDTETTGSNRANFASSGGRDQKT